MKANPAGMRVTGERVVTRQAGFNPTWQRHVAAYALSADFLPEAPIVDLGCGIGHSHHLLAPRQTIGVDIDAEALAGQDRQTVRADIRALPFGDGRFAGAIAVHSIEHVPDPERALAEIARVLRPDGVAVLVTPNALTFGVDGEILDPYHHVELAPDELLELCAAAFGAADLRGLFGSPRYLELVERERANLRRLLRLDPLRLRRLVPRRARQRLYDLGLRRARREPSPATDAIEPSDFSLAPEPLAGALDLVAVCREPRRSTQGRGRIATDAGESPRRRPGTAQP